MYLQYNQPFDPIAWLPTVMIGRLLICSWLRVLQVYSALQVKLELS